MPILSTDIVLHLSGGGGNTDPKLSLGGARATQIFTDASPENLFDNASGDETAAGLIDHRCLYVRNNHGSLTLENAKLWISQDSAGTTTEVDIGLDPAGLNGTATGPISPDTSPPAGVTFSHPVTKLTGLNLGSIPFGQHYAIWFRRTVNAGTAALNLDNFRWTIEGDTAA